jgi:hypothetical protein
VTARPGHALAALHAALADLHREGRQELLMTDEFTSELLEQVVAIEEILAARWPRSAVLRARLRRDLRASVRHADGRGFIVRRIEAISTGWISRPGTRLARREDHRAG